MSKKLFAVASAAALLGVVASLLIDPAVRAQAQPAVTFDWIPVGDTGNACDPVGSGNCCGSVAHTYRIAAHEVTNALYAAFLNGNGVVESPEQCEWGVALGASCQSLGFKGGVLSCNSSTCRFNTSGCFNCKPRLSLCSKNSECCWGSCRSGRCR